MNAYLSALHEDLPAEVLDHVKVMDVLPIIISKD